MTNASTRAFGVTMWVPVHLPGHRALQQMRKLSVLAAFSSLLLVAVAVANAAPPKSMLDDDEYLINGPGPFAWTCDAPPGKFNQVHAAIPGDHVVVTGNMRVVVMRHSPGYNGLTLAGFYDRKSKATIALQILTTHFDPAKISFSMLNGNIGNATVLVEQPNKESDFPFTLRLDHGRVSVSVAGVNSTSRARPWDLNGFTLACGGARVEYTNVSISVPDQG
jgi:hypothetical protein